jgi:hypothetical protein
MSPVIWTGTEYISLSKTCGDSMSLKKTCDEEERQRGSGG